MKQVVLYLPTSLPIKLFCIYQLISLAPREPNTNEIIFYDIF